MELPFCFFNFVMCGHIKWTCISSQFSDMVSEFSDGESNDAPATEDEKEMKDIQEKQIKQHKLLNGLSKASLKSTFSTFCKLLN